MSKVYLIDASPIFYKAFFAIPMLNSKNGIPTNAAYGYTNTLISILKKYQPEHIGVCFDSFSLKRKELHSGYKAERKPMQNSLTLQVPIVKEITEALGISVWEKKGYEADDLLGMLAHLAEREGREVVIISPDKDMCQLVNKNITVLDYSKKVIYDEAKVKEKFEVEASQIVDLLALSGDTVDGIPGIMGVGKKTAVDLLNKYKSFEGIYDHLDALKPALKNKMISGKAIGEISKQLATIITNLEIEIKDVDALQKGFADKEKLENMFDALNFISLKDKISDLE